MIAEYGLGCSRGAIHCNSQLFEGPHAYVRHRLDACRRLHSASGQAALVPLSRVDPKQAASLPQSTTRVMSPPLRAGKRLFVGGERSVRRMLRLRAVAVVVMFLLVVAVFWLDREGLRDNYDEQMSFIDVVYFTTVSITTIGYGDIVPISPRARLIDALVVTPIRLFMWFIFLGTAYQLVVQRWIEDIRMRRLQARLQQHVIVCGYGHSGRCAAAELVARGLPQQQVLIVDALREHIEAASEHGYVGILGDATREDTLRESMLQTARTLFVCTDRDDTNVLIILTARHLSSTVRIVTRVEEAENEKLLKQSGANATVMPSRIGGILMADAVDSSALTSCVMDLISADGEIMLMERAPRPQEIGRSPTEVHDALIVRVMRNGTALGFSRPELRIEAGDQLVIVSAAPLSENAGIGPA
jgi:voltage-gated potassium channel